MNSRIRCVLILACLAVSSVEVAEAKTRSVRVSTVVEGDTSQKSCEMQLLGITSRREFRTETVSLKGKSVLQLSKARESVWVFPANAGTLALGKGTFLDGYGILRPDAKKLKLTLRARSICKSPVLILDQHRKPVTKAEVHIKALVAHGDQKGPVAEVQWRCQTDAKGVFELALFDGKNLRYEITPVKAAGDALEGTTKIHAGMIEIGKVLQISCRRRRQNLSVQLKWDPAFSKKGFRTDGSLHYNIIQLANSQGVKQGHIGKTGLVRFYGVDPGKYKISTTEWSGKRFSITSGADVALKSGERLQHTLVVKPVELKRVSLQVVDEVTGNGLKGAVISTQEAAGITDPHGKVTLEMPVHMSNAPVSVSHEDYYPKALAISPKKGDVLLKLTPLPILRGKVSIEPTKPGGVQFSRMIAVAVSARGKRKKKCVVTPIGFQLSLLPGKYDLVVKGKCKTGGNMTLHEGRVTIGKQGAECAVQIPRVGKLTITVKSTLPKKAPKPKALVLVNKAGRRLWATELDPATLGAEVFSPIGDYRLLVVAASEKAGKLVGPVTVTGSPYGKRTVEVDQWHHLFFNPWTAEFSFGPLIP